MDVMFCDVIFLSDLSKEIKETLNIVRITGRHTVSVDGRG
jgi:hypothetical protein